MIEHMKFCKHCNVQHPLTEQHWQWDNSKNRFIACKIQRKEYYKKNKEVIRIQGIEYRQNNKDKIKKRGIQYRKDNDTRIKEKQLNWRLNNKHKIIQKNERYKKQCGDLIKLKAKARRLANPDSMKEYYKNNSEKLKLQKKEYYKKNKLDVIERVKKYREKNLEKINERHKRWQELNSDYSKRRYTNDIQFKLRCILRERMKIALKLNNVKKHSSVLKELGCTPDELREYLEKQFKPGMTWENHGFYGWHIDHRRPLCSFDLSDPEQYKQACHYTNLQPLWALDNLSKGGKYNEENVG